MIPITRSALKASKQARDQAATKKVKVKRSTIGKAATIAALATVSTSVLPTSALSTSPYFSPPKMTLSAEKVGRNQSASPSPNKKKKVERTNSFEPLWASNFAELDDKNVKVHTLILGTHPSIVSLSEAKYYGHPMNAFWWIAGDCLGFRRATGISPSSGKPYKFTSHLRYGIDRVIPYEDQTRIMASHGFAMWDLARSCKREGSLDSAIESEVPNDIFGFCQSHPSIRRIVLANGGTGSKFFVKHFKSWWESGELQPGKNKESQSALNRTTFRKVTNNYEKATITCLSAISVSPAAANKKYEEKRDFWEEHVYKPGLRDLEAASDTIC